MFEPEKTYRLVSDKARPMAWVVELLCDPFKGIIYSYGKFEFKIPKTEGGTPKLYFERDILYVPKEIGKMKYSDETREQFETLLGQILMNILERNMDRLKRVENKLVLEVK